MSRVSPSLAPFQYRCLKGSSTTVYLVRMYHFSVEWLDRGSTIVDLLLVDYRKAFDLIRNFIAMTNLQALGARKHFLLLVIGKTVSSASTSGDTNSEWTELTCGAPQGAKPAAPLFLGIINFVLSDFEVMFKYVDDLSVLLKHLIGSSEAVPRFSAAIMSNFKDQCTINSLQINEGKTKIVCSNPIKRHFVSPPPPYPSFSSAVILGVTFSVDSSFSTHVDTVIKKANDAMGTLILLRRFNFSVSHLKTAYLTYIRSIHENTSPAWGPQFNNRSYLSDQLESLQKRAFKVILSDTYLSYNYRPFTNGVWVSSANFANFFLVVKNIERFYHQL